MSSLPNLFSILAEFLAALKTLDLKLILTAFGCFVGGLGITFYIRLIAGTFAARHASAHHAQLLRRFIFYIGFAFSIIFSLQVLKINVTAWLVAATGIITAAVVFAAQTSTSNFLSGLFLLVEKSFEVNDLIVINNIQGQILSIDLLSVKIRMKDNTFVRIPNETLLKSQFKNLSRFPIRRFDIKLRFNSNDDLPKIKRILMEVARQNPLCLVSPTPELHFLEFGDAIVILQFSVWGKQASFTNLQTNIQMDIQAAFVTHDIKLPNSFAMHVDSAD